MPLYFFHLISPEERCPDETGCELPNVERAYLEVYQAALDISFEMLRSRRDPSALRFEVVNEDGEVLFDLPFVEALHPARPATTLAERQHEPTAELRAARDQGRSTILETREAPARPLAR